MSNEKIREEFEAWCISVGWSVQRCHIDENNYVWGMVGGAWKAWQASRAALCVELPRCWNDEQRDYRDDMVKSLDSAGVTYK